MSRGLPRNVGVVCALLVALGGRAATVEPAPFPPPALGVLHLALSPDGQSLAFSRHGAICRMPSAGGPITCLTQAEGWDIEPAWSPDGKAIVYLNTPALFVGEVKRIAAGDGATLALPRPILARGRLQFHPDGTRVLGRLTASGRPSRLQWVSLATGELTALEIAGLDPAQRDRMQWALSPDGAWVLFTTDQDRPGEQDGNDGPATDLWRVAAAGGTPQRVTRWPSRIYGLCWDASGLGTFAVTDRGGACNDLWHIPLARPDAGARQWTFGQADEDWPSASADGRWLFHTDNRHGLTSISRVELRTERSETLSPGPLEPPPAGGRLRLRLRDAQTGDPLVARVSVKAASGKYQIPDGAFYRLAGGAGHFYARGSAELRVPSGRVELQVWRGPEYLPRRETIEIATNAIRDVEVDLDRWIDLPSAGWFSGENHIHANYGYGAWHHDARTVRDLCEGEDLHVANVMVANSDGDGVFDRAYFLGQPDPGSGPRTILYWNEEFRSTLWGHLTLGNLSQLVEPIFTGFKDTTNPWDVPSNADIAERTRAQLGSVSYTHPASSPEDLYSGPYTARGLPVDAALGRIDTVDVAGFGYAASLQLWYRLLNCGFRLPAAAGTDCFLNRLTGMVPGWARAYVKLPHGLSYRAWIDGQKAGRSFVTDGPVLEFSVEQLELGETLNLKGPRSVRVRGRARAQTPLATLEIVENGKVAAAWKFSANQSEATLERALPLDRSSWLALRATAGPSPLGAGSQWAHTNPIYVEMEGRLPDSGEAAAFFLKWIDRLEGQLRQRDRLPRGREHVEEQLAAARAVYQKLLGGR